MPQTTHTYPNKDITVVWKPDVCIHSRICWKELNEVFKPKERPWIQMDGSTTERIIEQVRKCPSGALSYFVNEERAVHQDPVAEAAHITEIVVSANGPYIIKTECLLKHSDGREEIKTGATALCRCGNSQNKPYCDGSHAGAGFVG
jgi:uncharacterized Fe-S cluster protein YjdI